MSYPKNDPKPGRCGRVHLSNNEEVHVAQSLARVIIHLIFSTKNRYPFLREEVCQELHPYMATTFKSLDSPAIEVGSSDDHVHALFQLSINLPLSRVVEKLKTGTSKWIKNKGGILVKFHWQNGYAAFSVSPSKVEEARHYVANQREHHRTRSFQEELIYFLKMHQVPYDERYVWD